MRQLLSRILRRQDGIALPVVMGSLAVVSGLAVGTFAVSVDSHGQSARDRDSKKALAAAEAGLQMATLKITELEPEPDDCVTNDGLVGLNAQNECPGSGNIAIGNGATYNYVVSTPASGDCATIPGFVPNEAEDRCITSTGTVNGVQRRLQMRFYFEPPFLPWGNAGLVGKNKVDIGNNKIIDSAIGTNGNVILGNNSNAWELLLPDGATYTKGGPNATVDSEVAGGNAIRCCPKVAPWEFPETDWKKPATTNNNTNLNSIPGWDGKYLKLSQQQDITLPGGTYYMCGFNAPNGNDINVPAGQFVRLYIVGYRGNPACNPNDPIDGRFVIKNSGRVNPLPTTAPNAQQFALFVYGTTDDNTDTDPADVDINNGVSYWGTIWAPNSTISVWNNQVISGGFTAGTIEMKNNGGFSYDSNIANQPLPGTAEAENLSWTECRRQPTVATDPESGCS